MGDGELESLVCPRPLFPRVRSTGPPANNITTLRSRGINNTTPYELCGIEGWGMKLQLVENFCSGKKSHLSCCGNTLRLILGGDGAWVLCRSGVEIMGKIQVILSKGAS